MFKKIALFAFLLIPAFSFAQNLKLGHFNYNEVMPIMPEYAQMTDSLQKQAVIFEGEMKILNEELQLKYTSLLEQQDTLIESIRIRRHQDVQELSQRVSNFQQQAQQSQELLYNKLSGEILQKIQKVVQEVGTENNFTYIIDANTLWFLSTQSIDTTPLIKKKLGLQ